MMSWSLTLPGLWPRQQGMDVAEAEEAAKERALRLCVLHAPAPSAYLHHLLCFSSLRLSTTSSAIALHSPPHSAPRLVSRDFSHTASASLPLIFERAAHDLRTERAGRPFSWHFHINIITQAISRASQQLVKQTNACARRSVLEIGEILEIGKRRSRRSGLGSSCARQPGQHRMVTAGRASMGMSRLKPTLGLGRALSCVRLVFGQRCSF